MKKLTKCVLIGSRIFLLWGKFLAEEMNEVLDENGVVVAVVPRSEIKANALRHKSSFVILRNSIGQFYVQQRSKDKLVFPLLWETGASGGLPVGETFEEGAARELVEELGIAVPLKFLFDFSYDGPQSKVVAKAFLAVSDEKVVLSDESEGGKWISQKELEALLSEGLLCPDTAVMVRKYLAMLHA